MLFVGLGNPGTRYEKNRHNLGYLVIDALANALVEEKTIFQKKFGGEFLLLSKDSLNASGQSTSKFSKNLILFKPTTYMNNSGQVVQEIMRFYKLLQKNIMVIHDDLDLSLGRIKVKSNGGDGGHNGIKSVDSHIGKNYARLRIGIGRPANKEEVTKYVLKDFTSKEMITINIIIKQVIQDIRLLMEEVNWPKFVNNSVEVLRNEVLRNGIQENGDV